MSSPEALGIVPGTVFLMCLIVGSMWFYTTTTTTATPTKLLDVHSALLSICFMLFLGFTDDVLNWPWRYKLILPTVASLPLLCCYNGSTTIVVPIPLRPWIVQQQSESGASLTWLGQLASWFITVDPSWGGKIVDLGWWYLLYMSLLAVFCTNAINIYAGINGLEAGQAYVMACFVLIHNLIEMRAGGDDNNDNDYHLFSILLLLPFCGVTLGLLRYNWYPAQVFVGDTYCYFAGMTFAVVGILGHFSKTLLLFFLPQIVNFLWSCPQLFHLVPCPRHRLPRYDAALGKMVPSTFACEAHRLRFLKKRPTDTVCPNMTVINLCLQFCGPLTERTLCLTLLGLQVVSCTLGLFCRYYVAQFFFE